MSDNSEAFGQDEFEFNFDLTYKKKDEDFDRTVLPEGRYHAQVVKMERRNKNEKPFLKFHFIILAGPPPEAVHCVWRTVFETLWLTDANRDRIEYFARQLGLIRDEDLGKPGVRGKWLDAEGRHVVIELEENVWTDSHGKVQINNRVARRGIWHINHDDVADVPKNVQALVDDDVALKRRQAPTDAGAGPANAAEPVRRPEDEEVDGEHPPRAAIRAEEDGFRPDKEELRVLAGYWAQVNLNYRYQTYYNPELPGFQGFHRDCARVRLHDIKKVLGEDVVREVVGEVEAAMRRQMGDTRWQLFAPDCGRIPRGDTQSLDLGEELRAEWQYAQAKSQDLPLVQKVLAYLSANPQRVFVDEDGDLWYLAEVAEQNGGEGDVLNLVLRTWRGQTKELRQTVPKPSDWFPPYGLYL
jgi:hypothetical protein